MTIHRRQMAAGGVAVALLAAVGSAAPANAAADETSVAAAVEAYRKAILGRDKAALQGMTMPQLSYGHSSGVVQTQQEFVDGVMNAKATTKSIEFSKMSNAVAGDNAISRFVWTSESETEGKTTQTIIGVLIVWKQDGGTWKILGRQGYKI